MSLNNSDLQPVFWSYHGAVFICKDWLVLFVEICCRKKIKCPSVKSVILSDMKGATVQGIFCM